MAPFYLGSIGRELQDGEIGFNFTKLFYWLFSAGTGLNSTVKNRMSPVIKRE